FWQTWWIKALLVVIIGTLIFLAYWKRDWNIRTNKRKLELLVDQRTSQLKTKTDELEILNEEKNKLLEELRAANKKLEKMSRIDGLTRIPNRRFFDETLQVEWKRCQRRGSSISLLMVDVDYFKLYNDTYGHQEGDECLKLVGASLSLCISRAGDLAARYGGEEFSAIMVDADMEGATTKAEEIRAKVQKLKIPHEKSDICAVVTISVGVASIVPVDEKGCHKLVEAADSALYKAKHSGRNRVCTSQK
ncbi:MAG: diguanylate cyclase, partial [bacterium]|nr:diguanylate cyclase [bacterium]